MPGIATGEVYSFAEGKLYLYASASGNTSGSGIGFAQNASLRFVYGRYEFRGVGKVYRRVVTGQRAELAIETLLADLTLFRLANASAAVNAKFEALISSGVTQSAQWILYSGAVSEANFQQQQGDVMRGRYAMFANEWSAFGN